MIQSTPKFLAACSVSALLFLSGCGTESTPADANSNNQAAKASATEEVANLAKDAASNPVHKDLNGTPAVT